MGWQAWVTVHIVGLLIGLLIFTRMSADLVMLGGLTLLLTLGVLTPEQALAGFANEGTVTIGVLFIVVAGLRDTGALEFLASRVLGRPHSVFEAQVRMMLPVTLLSAFIYNAPLVAMMLPVVDDWAKKNRIPASKLMIPLSYATILGGLCTLIGTSTNLVVNGLVRAQTDLAPLELFDLTWVGLPCAVAGLAYILLASARGLPEHRPAISTQDDPRQYTVEMVVEPGSPLVGQTIEQAGLRHLPGLYLVEIDREGEVRAAVAPHERLHGRDRLVFAGVVESVVDLQKFRGLKPATDQVFKLNAPRSERCLIEAVVSDSFPLLGKTVREGQFRSVYNAAIIAVARNGERLQQKIGDIALRPGDTLLLEAHPSFVDGQRNSRDFFLVSRVAGFSLPRYERAWLAAAIMLGMIIAAGLGWLSMVNAALLAAGFMVLTRCCTPTAARQTVNWQVLVVIAASFGIGQAMKISGAADAIAHLLIGLGGNHPWLALAAVYGVTMLFTETIGHIAAVVVVFPIALATATSLGVNFMPFVLGITMAASCGFATPIGSPTNLMVYGPGNYRFGDFLRFGGPLNLIVWAVVMMVVPLVWPF